MAKLQVYVEAKECSEQVSMEEFAVFLAKNFTSFYQQVNLLTIYFKFLCIAYTEVAIKLLLITYINIKKYLQIDNKNIYYFYYQLQYINKYYKR